MRYPEDVPSLTDGEVTLRAHVDADVPRIVEQCRDPESVKWTTVPTPYAESDARSWVAEVIASGWVAETTYVFAIEYGGQFAGSIDLRIKGGGEAEIGYGLHPGARGQGVLRRAMDVILDWGFDHDIDVVHWRAIVGNWNSRRVVWRLGFTFGPTIPRLLPDREERQDGWTGWIGRDDPREPVEPWLQAPALGAEGVRLRPWRESDASRLVQIADDPVVRQWLPGLPLPEAPEDVPRYLRRIREGAANNERVAWCVADPETDQALGNIALFEFEDDADNLTAQVGYWAHPDARGRGLMAAAMNAACAWALTPSGDGGLGARRLYLLTSVRNTAARALAERAGFVHVGTERASGPVAGGGFEDSALYDRLRP